MPSLAGAWGSAGGRKLAGGTSTGWPFSSARYAHGAQQVHAVLWPGQLAVGVGLFPGGPDQLLPVRRDLAERLFAASASAGGRSRPARVAVPSGSVHNSTRASFSAVSRRLRIASGSRARMAWVSSARSWPDVSPGAAGQEGGLHRGGVQRLERGEGLEQDCRLVQVDPPGLQSGGDRRPGGQLKGQLHQVLRAPAGQRQGHRDLVGQELAQLGRELARRGGPGCGRRGGGGPARRSGPACARPAARPAGRAPAAARSGCRRRGHRRARRLRRRTRPAPGRLAARPAPRPGRTPRPAPAARFCWDAGIGGSPPSGEWRIRFFEYIIVVRLTFSATRRQPERKIPRTSRWGRDRRLRVVV